MPWDDSEIRRMQAQVVLDELALEHQVFGGVSRDRQLGKGHQIGLDGASLVYALKYLPGVAFQVADGDVDLGKRQSEGAHKGSVCLPR